MRWALRLTALGLGLACAPLPEARRAPAHLPPVLPRGANELEPARPPPQYRRVHGGARRDWPDASEPELLLVSGQRLLEKAGHYEVAGTAGASPLLSGTRAPALAGGGFVFWSRDGLYRSRTFLGPLQPLASTGFSPQHVAFGPGFLLVATSDGQRLVLDSKTGAARAPQPIGLVDIATSNDGRVVAALELGRAAVSLDQGASFREVQGELDGVVTALSREPPGFVVDGNALMMLTQQGALVRAALPSPHKPQDPRWAGAEPPLEHAVARGVLRANGRALVSVGAAVAEVDVQSGELVSIGQALLPGRPDCELLEQGDELLMKCITADALAFLSQPDGNKPAIERSFKGNPNTHSGFGQVLVEGSCDGSALALAVCVRGSGGNWRTLTVPELLLPADPKSPAPAPPTQAESARGYALKADGGAVAFVDGTRKGYVDLKTGHFTPIVAELSRAYDRQSRCVVDAAGALRCLTRDGPLAFGFDGKPEPRPVRFQWVGSSEQHALGLDKHQQLFQSDDWGRTWTEVATPLVMDRGADASWRCSEVGCRVGAWLRLGWQALPPQAAPAPVPIPLAKPATPRLLGLRCARQREPSVVTSPALLHAGETRLNEPSFGNEVAPASHFRMPILAGAAHQSGGDTMALRGLLSGLLTQSDRSGVVFATRPLQLRFVEYFDAQAREQSASISWLELARAARSVGNPVPGLTFEDQLTLQATPVLAREPGRSGGFVLNHEALQLWVRPGKVTPLPFDTNDGNWLVLSAVSEPDGGLSLLAEDGSGVRRAVRFANGAMSEHFVVPANVAVAGEASTPDALGVSADGQLAVLRFTSGMAAPSREYPVLAYRPGAAVESLAPWSTLRPASDPACLADKNGYRAIVMPTESWLALAGTPGQTIEDDWGMIASLRWSSERVCLESLELADEGFNIDDDALSTRNVVTFVDKPQAARLGFALGHELRQPLDCRLP